MGQRNLVHVDYECDKEGGASSANKSEVTEADRAGTNN